MQKDTAAVLAEEKHHKFNLIKIKTKGLADEKL
jgi:hypothetical protein